MQTIYQYDGENIYTGVSQEIADDAGCPLGWTFSVPPQIPDGKFAYYLPTDWVIIDERPAPPIPPTPASVSFEVAQPGEAPVVI